MARFSAQLSAGNKEKSLTRLLLRMNHTLQAEGFGIRIRPVRMEDAAFIVWIRGLEHVKGKLGDSAADVRDQEKWLEEYFKRDGDYYFIVETRRGTPIGTDGIYEQVGDSAEVGRFVICPDVPAALAASILMYDIGFCQIGLKELRATSVGTNRSLHSFIKKQGFRHVRTETGGRIIGGKPVDILHFILKPEDWAAAREPLIPLAQFGAEQIEQWEKRPDKHPFAR